MEFLCFSFEMLKKLQVIQYKFLLIHKTLYDVIKTKRVIFFILIVLVEKGE